MIDPRAKQSKTLRSKLNATGNQTDCLGMTPLHILACSARHDVRLHQLIIEKYPSKTLQSKYDATGNQTYCLGMTPLHILSCSARHDVRLHQLNGVPFLSCTHSGVRHLGRSLSYWSNVTKVYSQTMCWIGGEWGKRWAEPVYLWYVSRVWLTYSGLPFRIIIPIGKRHLLSGQNMIMVHLIMSLSTHT